MRLFNAGSNLYVDHEIGRAIKNAISSQRPPAGTKTKLLDNAVKMGAEFPSDSSIVSRFVFLIQTLHHQRWMTGDYGLGQDVKHSYLAGVAHISIA